MLFTDFRGMKLDHLMLLELVILRTTNPWESLTMGLNDTLCSWRQGVLVGAGRRWAARAWGRQ